MPTPEVHAKLSASSAHRWLNCPGSVRLTADLPDKTSEYAEAGRVAHALAELRLSKYFTPGVGQKAFEQRLQEIRSNQHYAPEMEHFVGEYVEYVQELALSFPSPPYVSVERRVDFSAFVPEGFGTADCVMIHGKELYITDFKYGQGVEVEAQDNPQLMLYAVGALLACSLNYDIARVHMTIVQPRAGGIKETQINASSLLDWAEHTVRPKAKLAFDGTDELHSGDWCRFCKAKATCRIRMQEAVSAVEDFGRRAPDLLSDVELGQLLHRLEPLVRYAEAVRTYAQDKLMAGAAIPGWKLVEGRSTRAWADQAVAFEALRAAGVDEALLYERKPLTAPAFEKVIGKKEFNRLTEGLVERRPGKPTLAPAEDARDAYNPAPTAAEDFKTSN